MQISTARGVGFLYVLFALLVAGYYAGVQQGMVPHPFETDPGLARNLDYLCVFALSVAGAVAIFSKAPPFMVLSSGSFAGLVALTMTQEPLIRFLTLGAILFAIGMYGMVTSRNAVRVLMSIELMLNAVTINLVAFARYVDPSEVKGQVFAIFVLTVAAAEAAVGLAIVLACYRNMATVDMDRFNLLKY
jgi:NAD(P)H-quinone oxidoreductase subunit 4L